MRRVLLLAASILAIHPVSAGAEWLTLRTAHHHVAGNVSARDLKDIALRIEQFREVEALNKGTVGDGSVVVLAFPDERSYRPFMPVANGRPVPVGGLFITGMGGPYITLNLRATDGNYRSAYHEFTHFLLRGSFVGVPIWFNEGLAEYYSTFDVASDGRRAVIGKPIAEHVLLLRDRRLPLSQLLSITAASPEYTQDTTERHLLYAQSWALVHHALHAKPQRRDAIVTLAFKLARGEKPEQAVQDAYGMTLPELERELQDYMRREVYSATGFEFKNSIVTTLRGDVAPADPIQLPDGDVP